MKRQRIVLILAMLALVLNLGHPASMLADEDNGWTLSKLIFVGVETNLINGCYSESVHLILSADISVLTRVDADGTVETKERDLFKADGIGQSSGARYKLREKGHVNESFGPNPDGTPFSYLERRSQRLIGLDGVPDQRVTYYIQLVIDGAGNVTADIFNVNLECDPGE
jgi:hypothetical protein